MGTFDGILRTLTGVFLTLYLASGIVTILVLVVIGIWWAVQIVSGC